MVALLILPKHPGRQHHGVSDDGYQDQAEEEGCQHFKGSAHNGRNEECQGQDYEKQGPD